MNQPGRSISSSLFGWLGLAGIFAMDTFYWKTSLFVEKAPDISNGHLLRSVVICLSVIAILQPLLKQSTALMLKDNLGSTANRASVWVSLVVTLLFLILFSVNPLIFNNISYEDGPIEALSFALLLCSSLIFLASLFFIHRKNSGTPGIIRFSVAFMALLLFIVAMEEVSWFQRVLNIDTPDIFEGNRQDEINLHNFYTNYAENLYYSFSWGILTLPSFIYMHLSGGKKHVQKNNESFSFVDILPQPFIVVIAALPCAYNFDMWDIIFTQIVSFSSIYILVLFSMAASKKVDKYTIFFTIILLIVTQLAFILGGENFSRVWEVTEFKETLISIALFIYSINVFYCVRSWHNARRDILVLQTNVTPRP